MPVRVEQYACIELGGVRYAIIHESALKRLARLAGREIAVQRPPSDNAAMEPIDPAGLAERLLRRRQVAGLTQRELARRAGIRVETLNRIERGHTTPDFGTIRKLVIAMDRAERHTLG